MTRPTALVTGASRGIGVALAREFAGAGHDLILTARDAGELACLAADLSAETGVVATAIAGDLAAADGPGRLAADIAAKGLGVDVLVNNAGFGDAAAFAASDRDKQLGMIDLNVRALVELTHIYWPTILAAGPRGGLLNVASTSAFQPGPMMAIYFASKAFVLSFTEALWEEARGSGARVSCLCPGPTESDFRLRAGTDRTRLADAGAPMPAAVVAREAYDGFAANRRVVVTGARNKAMATLAPLLPRTLVLRAVRGMMAPRGGGGTAAARRLTRDVDSPPVSPIL